MNKRKLLLLTTMMCVGSVVIAQHVPQSPLVLNVDYARFRNTQDSGYLEVYYGFYPRLVTLKGDSSTFLGALTLETTLYDAKTNQPVQRDRTILPVSLTDTSSSSSNATMVSQAGYQLPLGEYILRVTAVDSLTPSRRDSIDLAISLRGYVTPPSFSDLELCSEIKSSGNTSSAFYKNSFEVIPNSSLVFGVTAHPVIFHYVELYDIDASRHYTFTTHIIDVAGKIVRESKRQRQFTVQNAVDVGTTNVTSLESGKYRFVLSLADETGKEANRVEKSFYVYNPHIQPAIAAGQSLDSGELAALTTQELSEEFRKAQYLASDNDKKTFARISNVEGQRDFLDKFWHQVANGYLGKAPMSRTEYLRRVAIAEKRYGRKTREGWRSDRGRVFILYGDPDEIERMPSQTDSKPHEIWHYYQVENRVQFVFIDRSGFGDYSLVHSTKRGELRDDDWQRYLLQ